MTESSLSAGFLALYAQPLTGLDLLAKSAKQKDKALKIINPERDKHGRPDYHTVPLGHSVWIEINRPEHPLHHQHVLVTKTASGFRIANQLPPEQVRGTKDDVQRRRDLLANYDDEQRRKKDKEAAKKLKEDSANDPFVVLAGGTLPQTRVIQSPWPDEDEVTKSLAVSMGLTLVEKPQDAQKDYSEGVDLEKAHDVSGEPRDKDGKWTKGGGTKFPVGPAEHVAPFIGDVYKVAGRDGTFRLSAMTLHSVELRNDKGDEIPVMYPEAWDSFIRLGIIQLFRSAKDDPTPEKWQKTRAQFKAENPRDAWQHENAVFNALVDGKPVPDEVLKDYPDLKQKSKHFNFDSEVRENPQAGNEIRVVNPESPDYGRIFRVIGQRVAAKDDQNDYPGTKYVQIVKLDKDNKNPVNLPFEMALMKWKDLFPYRAMGDNLPGPYADALPEKWSELPASFNYTVAAYIDGDRKLPDPTGRKIDHIALGPSDLSDAQAKARKIRVTKVLTAILADNKDFSDYAEKIGRDVDARMVQSKTFMPGYIEQAQNRLDNPTAETKRQRIESAVSSLVSTWAHTSSDSSNLSLGVQRAAQEVFNLDPNRTRLPWLSGGGIKNGIAKDESVSARKDYQQNGAAYRAFVQAQYNITQQFLQQHNIKKVTLYRGFDASGMRLNAKVLPSNGETVTLEMQPLSSFSTDKGIATVFGRAWTEGDGRVIVATVPAADIAALPFTGSGCLVEREAIVLGKPLTAKIYGVSRDAVRLHGEGHEDTQLTKIWDDGEFNKSNDLLNFGAIPLDERLRNADWTKTTWDLPPLRSPAMKRLMCLQGKKSLYDLRGLPVWQAYIRAKQQRKARKGGLTKSHDVSQEARDKDGKWTKVADSKQKNSKPKEDWELTQEEFAKRYGAANYWRHENLVGRAIVDGKDVPERVLADYPKIQQDLPRKKRDIAQLRRQVSGDNIGDEFVVGDSRLPQYGMRFKVLGREDTNNDTYLRIIGRYPGGAISPPFLVPEIVWQTMLLPAFYIVLGMTSDSWPLHPYRAGDTPPLPVTGKYINYYANEKLYNQFLGKPQKIRAMKLLANRLLDNSDFQRRVKNQAAVDAQAAIRAYETYPDDKRYIPPSIYQAYQQGKKLNDYLTAHDGELSPEAKTRMTQKYVAKLVDSWANSSADSDAISVNLQRATDEEFGLHSTYKPWLSSYNEHGESIDNGGSVALSPDVAYEAEQDYKQDSPSYRAFVRAEYNATQEVFRSLGIKTMKLYRGIVLDEERFAGSAADWNRVPERGSNNVAVQVQMQPISSFATSFIIANEFAVTNGSTRGGRIIQTDVPVERILATPLTGVGCLHERECVVLGGKPLVGFAQNPTDNALGRQDAGEDEKSERFWEAGPEAAMKLAGAKPALDPVDYSEREG